MKVFFWFVLKVVIRPLCIYFPEIGDVIVTETVSGLIHI